MNSQISSTVIHNYESFLLSSNKNINTVKKYVRDINRLHKYLSDNARGFEQSSVDEYLQSLIKTGYEIRSVNSVIASIKSFCKFSNRADIYCKSLKIRKKNNHDVKKRLTAEEYILLIQTAMQQKRFTLVQLIQVLGNTELRVNELRYLTVDALEVGVVTVTRAGEDYDIYLSESLIAGIKGLIEYLKVTEGIIFRTSKGKVLDRAYIWRQMKEVAEVAGVDPDKVYPQNLKRQFAREYFDITYPE